MKRRGHQEALGPRAEPVRHRLPHPELLEEWRPIAEDFDIFFGLESASDAGLAGIVKDTTTTESSRRPGSRAR